LRAKVTFDVPEACVGAFEVLEYRVGILARRLRGEMLRCDILESLQLRFGLGAQARRFDQAGREICPLAREDADALFLRPQPGDQQLHSRTSARRLAKIGTEPTELVDDVVE